MTRDKNILNKAYIFLLVVFFGVLALATYFLSASFSKRYLDQVAIDTQVKTVGTDEQTFSVQKIILTNNQTGETFELLRNGTASISSNTSLKARTFLSNDRLLALLSLLSQEDFDKLAANYFSNQLNISLTIQTNFGTKQITIGNTGGEPLPKDLEEIIDEIEDIENELKTTPTPSALPTATPTTQPGSSSTPVPTATSIPSTPLPTPIGATAEPFSCDMLSEQNVTVSNTRCIEDN